jgi:hypothetical protein
MEKIDNNRLIIKLKWFLENNVSVCIRTKNDLIYVINDFEIFDNFLSFKDKYSGTDIIISLDNIAQICKSKQEPRRENG